VDGTPTISPAKNAAAVPRSISALNDAAKVQQNSNTAKSDEQNADNVRYRSAKNQENTTVEGYFTAHPDRIAHTLSAFQRDEFKAYRNKEIRPNELQALLNLTGIKAIEKDLIKAVIETNYKGKKTIPFNELETTVRANIIPLDRIESKAHSDFGMANLGDTNEYGDDYTLILNMPKVEHGVRGHFYSEFRAENLRQAEYEAKQLDENTWVAVEKDYMRNGANQENIMQFVGTAGSRESVEQWIEDYTNNPKKGAVNIGMYGHIRVWDADGTVYIPEMQSDVFQKHSARKLIVESKPEYKEGLDKINSKKNNIDITATVDILKDNPNYKIELDDKEIVHLIDMRTGESLIHLRKILSPNTNLSAEEYTIGHKIVESTHEGGSEIADIRQQTGTRIDKLEKQLEKEKAQLEQKVYNGLSKEEKQLIASQKVFERRLVHEAVAEARSKGADAVRFPAPHTLAVIENYISNDGRMPYSIESAENNEWLTAGDKINVDGTTYIVAEYRDNSSFVAVAEYYFTEIDIIDVESAAEDEATRQVDFEIDEVFGDKEELSVNDLDYYSGDVEKYITEYKENLEENDSADTSELEAELEEAQETDTGWEDILNELYAKYPNFPREGDSYDVAVRVFYSRIYGGFDYENKPIKYKDINLTRDENKRLSEAAKAVVEKKRKIANIEGLIFEEKHRGQTVSRSDLYDYLFEEIKELKIDEYERENRDALEEFQNTVEINGNSYGYPNHAKETFWQPSEYDMSVEKDKFDTSALKPDQQRVMEKYEGLDKQLSDEFGKENVQIVEDNNGFDWVELDLTSDEVQQHPIVAFRSANQRNYDFDVSGITAENAAEMQRIKDEAQQNGTYMKAPNGKPTNLNERQWLQVRTPKFKKWFGDWELKHTNVKTVFVDKQTAPQTRADAITVLDAMRQDNKKRNGDGKDYFVNNHTGAHIYISNTDAKHSMMFRNIDQIRAVGKVNEMIENAVKIGEVNVAEDEASNTKSVSIYYVPVNVGGVPYSARMVVKEYFRGIAQLDEIHLYNYLLKEKTSDNQSAATKSIPTHLSDVSGYKISDLIHNTQIEDEKLLDDHSKVLDTNGEPMPVYHGTAEDIDEVSKGFSKGFWTSSRKSAEGFGDVMAAFINIRNTKPLDFEWRFWDDYSPGGWTDEEHEYYEYDPYTDGIYSEATKAREDNDETTEPYDEDYTTDDLVSLARRHKYDGAIFKNVAMTDDNYIAFNSNQIKSATSNNGNFDGTDNDIRFRFAGEKGAANLDKAEEVTTRLDNLAVARQMEQTEKDAKAIKLATGWERGADGKWRYEIDDAWADALIPTKRGTTVAYHKEDFRKSDMYKMYPILSDLKITLSGYRHDGRDFDFLNAHLHYPDAAKKHPQIFIDYYGEEHKPTPELLKAIIVHEVQHIIQQEEGFAVGGNTANPNYYNLAGEVEARNAVSRMNMSDEERRASLAQETEDVARDDQIFLFEGLDDNIRFRSKKDLENSEKNTTFAQNFNDNDNEKRKISRLQSGSNIEIWAGKIIGGQARIGRLNPEEERGRIAGGRRNVEATLVAGANYGTSGRSQSSSYEAVREEARKQKDALKQYAEQVESNNPNEKVWYSHTDIEEIRDQSDRQHGGAEAEVYFMPDGSVIKVVEHNNTPLEFLDDRITLYNHLNPETGYELLGFADNPYDENLVSFIVKQQHVQGKTLWEYLQNIPQHERDAAEQKLKDWLNQKMLKDFGAVPAKISNTYKTRDYYIRDLHWENLMTTENPFENPNTLLYIIDTNLSLNTVPEDGGTREYGDYSVVDNETGDEIRFRSGTPLQSDDRIDELARETGMNAADIERAERKTTPAKKIQGGITTALERMYDRYRRFYNTVKEIEKRTGRTLFAEERMMYASEAKKFGKFRKNGMTKTYFKKKHYLCRSVQTVY
jgi:hypothetical protein